MLSTRAATLPAFVALAVVGSLGACALAPSATAGADIVIAADLELSGATADIGTAYNRALQLKADQINASGVLGGRKIQLIVKDNRSDRSLSAANISEFVNNPAVSAIVTGACSSCILASAKTISDRKVPAIALAAADGVANPVTDRRYLFKIGPNPEDGAAALVGELARANVTSVALLSTDDEYGRDGALWLGRELAKTRIELVATARFKATDTDLAQPVQRAVDAEPGAIILWTYPRQAAIATVTARDAGFTGGFYLDTVAAGDLFLTGPTARASEGALMVTTQTMAIDDVIANTPAKASRKQWFRDYTSRYGGYYGHASFAADAIQIIANAVTAVGGTDRDRLRDTIETMRLDGLSGPIRLTPASHSGLMPQALALLVARNGRWRLVS